MNDAVFHWPDVAKATSGTWLTQPTAPYATTVVDDNRTVSPGCIFVAIVGTRVDGHAFLSQVALQGASAVCVQCAPDQETLATLRAQGCGCLLVSDGLRAFQSLANLNRRQYP
ncbi:MAG: hypothetical protein IJJ33_13805, partial [Victivallales bacterium]|nr:hypothetical protein [Victivallales bacterium]